MVQIYTEFEYISSIDLISFSFENSNPTHTFFNGCFKNSNVLSFIVCNDNLTLCLPGTSIDPTGTLKIIFLLEKKKKD